MLTTDSKSVKDPEPKDFGQKIAVEHWQNTVHVFSSQGQKNPYCGLCLERDYDGRHCPAVLTVAVCVRLSDPTYRDSYAAAKSDVVHIWQGLDEKLKGHTLPQAGPPEAPRQPLESREQCYSVDEDAADDPEASWHGLLTAAEIGARYPLLGPLFKGDGTESLTYVAELWRVRIEPRYENDRP